MADGDIPLPPELLQIAGIEAGRVNRLGTPLPANPANDLSMQEPDGSIRLDLDDDGYTIHIGSGDQSLSAPYIRENREPPPFGENLAETLPESTLVAIGSEIVQGIISDDMSRASWIDQYNKGIDLLGTKVEELANRGQRRNVSRAGHPLLIEAMVKYWAGAAGEMLPAAGPVKVPTIGQVSEQEQQLADAFQADFNYFLTYVAREYRPDSSQMLMQQAFCGIGYKKVYRDPITRRPTSRSINAPDLIVSAEATDLDTAQRVTHAIQMSRAQLRRMQITGHYRDIDLGLPGMAMGISSMAQRKIKENEGITIGASANPLDMPYELRECDSDLDIDHYLIDGFYERRTPDGLPLPYKVALEFNSQKIVGLWRNWKIADKLCRKRNAYVKFGLVPGLDYYDWGFLQLLGNQTRVLRAIWRLMIDAGMFGNFPGGLKASKIRTSTNEIAPGPGEFVDIDIGPQDDIRRLVMPMPYKDISPTLIQAAEIIKNDAMRLAGTVMLESGEGRTNVPVGTVLATIEQQVQVMAQVYKNNHASQKDELHKLRELFAEDPQSLSLLCRERPESPTAPLKMWQEAQEFMDLNLQPASDPNVPGAVHRLMMANALAMLAQQMPQLFDVVEVARDAVTAIGKDPARFVVQPQPQAQSAAPDPKIAAAVIKAQTEQQKDLSEQAQEAARLQVQREKLAVEASKEAASNATEMNIAHLKTGMTGGTANGISQPMIVGPGGQPPALP